MTIEVRSKAELEAAMNSGEDEIIVLDSSLAKQLKAVKFIKELGPVAVAAAIAAVPLIVSTGGVGLLGLSAVAPGAAWATSTVAVLIVAVGGAIAISLFTDWEYVELPMGIKLKRRGSK